MIASVTTALSSSRLLVSPLLASTLQLSNSLPPLRFYSLPSSRGFHRQRYSEPRCFITRVAESIAEGFWEEPDDGFGSEGDESEDEMIGEEQIETAYSRPSNASHSESEYERLVKEVEQLLEPEERDILQHNEVPDISKISTKWSLFHSLGLSLQIPLMDKLLERGCDIDSIDKDGYTALHKAVIGKKEAVISHLLRKGANPLVRDRCGATALHYAVQAGAMQTVKLLIKYKVDVNVADNDGWTPLHISMQSRSRDIAKVLLVNGADTTRRNKDGKTPLDLSLCYGRDFKSYDLAKLLKLVPANRNP
ncbi:ankyrin repeat domain-containing protein EMB506, chloroplastic isoform X2 [Dendrobium catenatum]|uniref:ankyrin repeat domain-containing protein EMB506, chloroplastic isoform X2 n=1 Tax=Dendrobium catenatum TaxID=906689 RepID=UPI0009F21B57|nr:ankyrin repeat domain-containing protein EMB506, chloroplastic isoform X2 [Dendrobium catenatum]